MKKLIYISLCFAICAYSCNEVDSGENKTTDESMTKITMPEMPSFVENFEGSGIDLAFKPMGTCSNAEKIYEVDVCHEVSGLQMINYLLIEPAADDGFIVSHYSEDYDLIASIVYDENGKCIDISVDTAVTRGFWWNCTKYEYQKQKERFEEKSGALDDALADFFPLSTIRLVAVGLYCMGLN